MSAVVDHTDRNVVNGCSVKTAFELQARTKSYLKLWHYQECAEYNLRGIDVLISDCLEDRFEWNTKEVQHELNRVG